MFLVIQRQLPYSSLAANESLDIALGFAVMDQPCALLFADEGVYQLLKNQSPLHQKNLVKHFSALPLYGIDTLYCDQASLDARGVTSEQLIDGVTLLDSDAVKGLIQGARGVFSL
jgi:tRNA 2-thiouridine synthesizing protein C